MSRNDDSDAADEAFGQRLDKWLWYTRIVKSRSLAQKLITDGKVRVNRQKTDKPALTLKVGDVVTASVHQRVRVLEVLATGTRRGPAEEAQGLYREILPEVDPAAAVPAARRDADGGRGRPTKRDRRMIDRLKGGQ